MTKPSIEQAHEGRREIDSAAALWRDGLVPEAHAHMTSALSKTLLAWAPAAPPAENGSREQSDEPREQQAFDVLGRAGYRTLDRLKAARAATVDVEGRPLPMPLASTFTLNPDFEWIWAEAERLSRFTVRHFTPPSVRRRTRRRATIALGAAAVAVLLFMVRLWGRPRVMASSDYSPEYAVTYAVDGSYSTEWLLPNGSPGWLQIAFRSPRRVRSVRLTNAHNGQHLDRGAQQVRVTAFSDQGPVGSAEGRFDGVTSNRSQLDFSLGADRVTYLRVEVLSYFGLGGGFAEVEVR